MCMPMCTRPYICPHPSPNWARSSLSCVGTLLLSGMCRVSAGKFTDWRIPIATLLKGTSMHMITNVLVHVHAHFRTGLSIPVQRRSKAQPALMTSMCLTTNA